MQLHCNSVDTSLFFCLNRKLFLYCFVMGLSQMRQLFSFFTDQMFFLAVMTLLLIASPALAKQPVTQKPPAPTASTGKQSPKTKAIPKKVVLPAKKPPLTPRQRLKRLMTKKGLQMGDPVFIRIFKKEGLLELWMRSEQRFTLLKTYPVCKSSGHIGPKLAERDYQSPEGFYSVGRSQMKPNSSYHRAFNIGFPNKYDHAWGRTGSLIMVHGACKSVGCFAMTNRRVGEIYRITDAALRNGQGKFQVHIFPFRMPATNIDIYKKHRWKDYWWNLKQGYDMFESALLPPIVSNEGRKYVFSQPPVPEAIQRPAVPAKVTAVKKKKTAKKKKVALKAKKPKAKKEIKLMKSSLHSDESESWKPF